MKEFANCCQKRAPTLSRVGGRVHRFRHERFSYRLLHSLDVDSLVESIGVEGNYRHSASRAPPPPPFMVKSALSQDKNISWILDDIIVMTSRHEIEPIKRFKWKSWSCWLDLEDAFDSITSSE